MVVSSCKTELLSAFYSFWSPIVPLLSLVYSLDIIPRLHARHVLPVWLVVPEAFSHNLLFICLISCVQHVLVRFVSFSASTCFLFLISSFNWHKTSRSWLKFFLRRQSCPKFSHLFNSSLNFSQLNHNGQRPPCQAHCDEPTSLHPISFMRFKFLAKNHYLVKPISRSLQS